MADAMTTVTPIVALDFRRGSDAIAMIDQLGDVCDFYKIGSELYTAEGNAMVRDVLQRGKSVFLDLKFHDIPNTVRGAARSAAALGVQLLTVHASGGGAMIEAAVAGAREGSQRCDVLAVTILTSLDAASVSTVWGRAVDDIDREVVRLAEIAAENGAHGVVCSGHEAAIVKAKFGGRLATLVPGIRLAGGERQDQARVVTPRQAAEAGARYIVLGRAVTGAKSPQDAMRAVLALLQFDGGPEVRLK